MTLTKRANRAYQMLLDETRIEWVDEHLAKVESATTPGDWYIVDIENKACSCPDHVYRGTTCKHLYLAAADAGVLSIVP